ncbi:MAG: hypothetical protein IPL40_08540 [Proteobacteria bacterium]|nr:hypothetical protein [Pseudomonadota bacterium]
MRLLLRALRLLLVLLLALGAALTCWLRFAPDDLLRRALVVVARRALALPALDLEALELHLGLRGAIRLRGLVVGPPRGFTLSTLTLERLTLRYDLRGLPRGVIIISRFEVERPVVRLERRGERASWLALAGAAAPAPVAAPAEPAPTAASPVPAGLDLRLRAARLHGIAIYFDDGARRLVLDGLELRARARLVGGGGQARVVVALAPPSTQRSSVGLALRAPVALRATLDTRLRAVLDVEAIAPLRAALSARLDLRTETLAAPWALPPTALALRCDAEADQRKGQARLRRLTLDLNGARLLQLKGRAEGLNRLTRVRAELSRLLLPLAALLPYARLLQPGLRATGTVAANALRAEFSLPSGGQARLKTLKGTVSLDAVGGALPTAGVALRGLDGRLDFDVAPGRAALTRRSGLKGSIAHDGAARLRLSWRELRAGPAAVGDLTLKLRGGFDLQDLRPTAFDADAELRIGSLRQQHPRFGLLQTSARLSAHLSGQAEERRAELSALRLQVGRHLRVALSASTRDWAAAAGEARLELEPLALAGLWQELPGPLRQTLPLRDLGGEVTLTATLRGARPAAGTSPLRLPLELRARLGLREVRLAQRASGTEPAADRAGDAALSLAGLSGEVNAASARGHAKLDGRLAVASLQQPGRGLRLRGLALPFALTLSPRAINAEAQLAVGRLEQRQAGATLRQRELALTARASAALPLEQLLAGRTVALRRASLALTLAAAQTAATQQGVDLVLDRLRGRLDAELDPRRAAAPLRWEAGLDLGALRERVQGARLAALALKLRGVAGGWRARLPISVVTPAELWGGLEGELTLGRLAHGALLHPLVATRLGLAARLVSQGPFELQRLELALPTLGLSAAASGTLERPWELLAAGGRYAELPGFDLRLRGDLSNPSASEFAAARALHHGLRSAGALGLQLHLRAIDPTRLQVEGWLRARRFSLWLDGPPQAIAAAGPQGAGWLRSRLHLAGLDAEVPLSQVLVLRAGEGLPTLALPPARHSTFEQTEVGAAYRLVRPFIGGRSNLSFDAFTLRSQLVDAPQGQARIRSQSELRLGRTVLDLALRDGTLWLNHLALQALGGDLVGDLQLQLLRLQPLDLRLRADARLTNVDLARLDALAARRGRPNPLSALVALQYQLSSQGLSGQLLLDDLSLATLDSLLAYLDPHGLDPSVQANRRLLNAWYTRWTRPQVQRVAVWMAHSQLNLDIRLGAIWPLGAVLRRALHGVRVRRMSLRPFLPPGDDPPPASPPLAPARPRSGHWERPTGLTVE